MDVPERDWLLMRARVRAFARVSEPAFDRESTRALAADTDLDDELTGESAGYYDDDR